MDEDPEGLEEKRKSIESLNESNTPSRPQSSSGQEESLETRKKKKLNSPLDEPEEGHEVTFTVTIAMAIPTVFDDLDGQTSTDPSDLATQNDLQQKRTVESPRAQNYYHLEYTLMPDEEMMKTDVVTYGVACKVFTEKHDAKVIKTWQEGEITWVAWAHSHTVKVTREMLLKLFSHTLVLKVWDTKDKCSTRARFDRPKAFRLPQPKPGEKPEDVGGVKAIVTKQLRQYASQQPRKGPPIRGLPSQVSVPSLALTRLRARGEQRNRSDREALSASTKVLVAVPNKDGQSGKAFDFLSQLAGADSSSPIEETPDNKKAKKTKAAEDKTTKNSKPLTKEELELKKLEAEKARILAENIKKYGLCTIPLRLALLFGECKYVSSRLDGPVTGIEDIFLGVSVNSPLLSDVQREKFNPMMIRIDRATNMPDTPLSFQNLRQKCQPVFCKYKFLNQPDHVTPGKEHGKNIYWENTNVILFGDFDTPSLLEFLNGPGLEIEVHDRDRKPEEVTIQPKLFGDDLEDEKIANVGTIESRRTLYNPFEGRDKPWDHYGVARVNLSELLLGHKFLKLKVPILNCPIPDLLGHDLGRSGKLMGIAGAVDGPVDSPLPAGHYVDHMSILTVRIELAHPIISTADVLSKEYIHTSPKCPFNRIIFMFDYNNVELLHNIQVLVMGFNAAALKLNSLPQHVIDAALSTYKLSVVQQSTNDLDIVTGFHVLDGENHIVVLEGLRDHAILTLWEALPQAEDSDVLVLYNSDLSFSQRLYGSLDVDLCKVKLHEPLRVIVKQPLLYVRDMVFRTCYEALIKLHQMTKTKKMTDVVRNDLFPTAEMVVTMSREFGVPFTQKDHEDLQLVTEEDFSTRLEHSSYPEMKHIKYRNPVDNFNTDYIQSLNLRKETTNFIKANITDVDAKSAVIKAEKDKNKKLCFSYNLEPAYNYSIQHLNSSELAKEKLRTYLKEEFPKGRFMYNKEFLSGMFCPVDMDQAKKLEEERSRKKWKTEEGWVYPGVKSLKDSNTHPCQPHESRLEDLKEPWSENILHGNLFVYPVDRGRYPWFRRQDDLELYKKPAEYFFPPDIMSMYTPWQQEVQEKQERNKKKLEEWKSHVVVDDICQHFHRLLPQTEMTPKGFKSSNQIDRLQGLLKDPIHRKNIMFRDSLNNIPALGVVNDPLLDTYARQQGLTLLSAKADGKCPGYKPGDRPNQLFHPRNYILRHDYEHQRYRELKGHDFDAYYKPRSAISKRPIYSLLPDERDNHLFRTYWSPYGHALPPVGHTSSPEPIDPDMILNDPEQGSAMNLEEDITLQRNYPASQPQAQFIAV